MKKKRNHLRRYNSLQDCESGLSLFADKRNRTLLHGKQNTAGKILIFWWDDESIYKNKEKQKLTSSSTFQQENRADEKRKNTPHSTSLFFWWAVWWNDDEHISFWLSVYYPVNSSIHRIFIRQQVCGTNGWKEMPLSASWSVGHPTCLLSDQPTREGVSYQWKEKSCLYSWYSHRLFVPKSLRRCRRWCRRMLVVLFFLPALYDILCRCASMIACRHNSIQAGMVLLFPLRTW